MNWAHRWYCRSAHWQSAVAGLVAWVFEGVEPTGGRVLEVGPGYGAVTQILAPRVRRLTAVEVDPDLAHSLRRRLNGATLDLVQADAASLPFASDTFASVIALSVLHHVPARQAQDRLFSEAARVMSPGGTFVGYDVSPSFALRLFHLGDTFNPVAVDTLAVRLAAAGFDDVAIEEGAGGFRFRARTAVAHDR